MRQKFFSNTLQSSFIKNLLHSVSLPTYKTVDTEDYLIENNLYTHGNKIVLCTKTGYLNRDPNHCDPLDKEDYAKRQLASYKKVEDYSFGEKIPKFTNTFYSRYDFHDSETHERLGQFLRCYRDIFKINLLPFYNVFSGKYQDGFLLEDDEIIDASNTSSYKTFKIPIEYNKTYTIAIDSNTEVTVGAALIRTNSLLAIEYEPGETINLTNGTSNTQESEEDPVYYKEQLIPKFYKQNVDSYTSTAFRRPFTFRVNNVVTYDEKGVATNDKIVNLYHSYERDLYMLIQVSSLNTSSLVVLDGDFTDTSKLNVFSFADEEFGTIEDMDDVDLNKMLLSDLSLLTLSDGTRYPFSDRLIEYLLGNVITLQDEISDDITRVQNTLVKYDPFLLDQRNFKVNGIWTNYLRAQLYYKYFGDSKRDIKYNDRDISGYVDKDIEDYFIRKVKTGGK